MADEFCLKMPDFHVAFRDLLHGVNLRHGTDGFTSTPKEGVLRILSPWKSQRLRPGLNPRTWVPKASTLPVDHRSCWAVALLRKKTLGSPALHGAQWSYRPVLLSHGLTSSPLLTVRAENYCSTWSHSLGLLWTRDRPVAEVSTRRHATTRTSMPPVGFEPAISGSKRPHNPRIGRASTVIGRADCMKEMRDSLRARWTPT